MAHVKEEEISFITYQKEKFRFEAFVITFSLPAFSIVYVVRDFIVFPVPPNAIKTHENIVSFATIEIEFDISNEGPRKVTINLLTKGLRSKHQILFISFKVVEEPTFLCIFNCAAYIENIKSNSLGAQARKTEEQPTD